MAGLNDYFRGGGTYADEIAEIRNQIDLINLVFIGQYVWMPPKADSVNAALIAPLGQELSRLAYPALWAWAQQQTDLVVDDATWMATRTASPNNACALYSSGDGSATFRIPDMGDGHFIRLTRNASESEIDGGFADTFKAHLHTINHDHPSVKTSTTGNHYHTGAPGMHNTYNNQHSGCAPWGVTNRSGSYNGFTYNGWASSSDFPRTDTKGNHSHSVNLPNFSGSSGSTGDGETRPKGDYKRVYIYTGNDSSIFTRPTPQWIEQQSVNTSNIADNKNRIAQIEQYPTDWVDITTATSSDIQFTGNASANAGELWGKWLDPETYLLTGIIRGSGLTDGEVALNLPSGFTKQGTTGHLYLPRGSSSIDDFNGYFRIDSNSTGIKMVGSDIGTGWNMVSWTIPLRRI